MNILGFSKRLGRGAYANSWALPYFMYSASSTPRFPHEVLDRDQRAQRINLVKLNPDALPSTSDEKQIMQHDVSPQADNPEMRYQSSATIDLALPELNHTKHHIIFGMQ